MIGWGVLGAGSIARALATAVRESGSSRLAAVGSRDLSKAEAFAAEFGGAAAFGSYEEMVQSPDVDVVYVATPHPMHCEHTLLALEAGKAVLCEKPFAMNAAEARQMVATARERGVFLMEGMWTRFFPISATVRELVAEGAIGKVRMLTADFGFRAGFDPKSRLFDPALGGGALLDVGIYVASYASMLLGKPSRVTGMMQPAQSGVDAVSAMIFGYEDGALAILSTAVEAQTPWEATIVGEAGRIRVHSPFWKPSALTITRDSGDERIELPFEGNGFGFEVAHVEDCLAKGLMESPVMPLDETVEILETLDEVRSQWGLRYPGE